jgi:hypothetical protein
MESKSRGVMDTPLEPVIGLAEGETRWRGMTAVDDNHAGSSYPAADSISIVRCTAGRAIMRA